MGDKSDSVNRAAMPRLVVEPGLGVARLAAHALSFFVLAGWPLRAAGVEPGAWLVLYAAGAVFLCAAPGHRAYPRSIKAWLAVAFYSVLLAAVFFGADFALQTLGNSARPRASLPSWFGGLELYYVLVPGVTSVAIGALTGAVAAHLTR